MDLLPNVILVDNIYKCVCVSKSLLEIIRVKRKSYSCGDVYTVDPSQGASKHSVSQAWPDPCVYEGSGPQRILNLCQLQKFCSRQEVTS